MFRNFVAKLKRKRASWSSNADKEKKIKQLKEWAGKTGVEWRDIEDVLFWKEPRVSLALFIVATGVFWKLISTKLQKFGLIVIAGAVPCSFPETRSYITNNLSLEVDQSTRNLGFSANDVYDVVAELWWKYDAHYDYLHSLKHTNTLKFYLFASAYAILVIFVFGYIPIASIVYTICTLAYFYPVLNYLDVFNVLASRAQLLGQRACMHWSNSRTKRHRAVVRPTTAHARNSSDIENEEFIPLNVAECEKVFEAGINDQLSSSEAEEDDGLAEFDICEDFEEICDIGSSSSNDEDSFLPVCSGDAREMPSLSQIDA